MISMTQRLTALKTLLTPLISYIKYRPTVFVQFKIVAKSFAMKFHLSDFLKI